MINHRANRIISMDNKMQQKRHNINGKLNKINKVLFTKMYYNNIYEDEYISIEELNEYDNIEDIKQIRNMKFKNDKFKDR